MSDAGDRRQGQPRRSVCGGDNDESGLVRGTIKDGHPDTPDAFVVLGATRKMKNSTILLTDPFMWGNFIKNNNNVKNNPYYVIGYGAGIFDQITGKLPLPYDGL